MKKAIKAEMMTARDNHPPGEVVRKSLEIEKRLLGLSDFGRAKTILFYASIKNEVQTLAAIKRALALGKRVVLPVTEHGSKELGLYELTSADELKAGHLGIPEPSRSKKVDPADIDLIIVPGVAFDLHGDRLGYGIGYYDRLLKKTTAHKIALAFDFQVVPALPREEHDVRVDKIITESGVIECRPPK